MFWIFLFLKDFLQGCVRSTFSRKYKQHLFLKQSRDGCKNRLQPFDPLSPHKDCVVQSSFEITLFLLKHLTALQSGKTTALKERLPCPWPVSKLPGPSVSPPSLFSENSLSNVLQTDVKCRSDVTKWLSLGYSWPSVSTCGSKIVAFKLQETFWHALTWARWL